MKKTKQIITTAICITILLVIAFSAWRLWQDYRESRMSDEQTEIKPTIQGEEDSLPLMDFTELKERNPDIIAWLTVDEIGVDYPVVQGADNDYYLRRTVEKVSNKLGTLFLDYRNNANFSDFYSVIYGHNMQSGQMFGQLVKFKDKDFFDQNVSGILYTPNKTYRLEFFAVAVDYHVSDYYQYAFPAPADKEAHLSMIRETAKLYRDIGITPEDTLLALSTCSYEFKNARTLVIARLSN